MNDTQAPVPGIFVVLMLVLELGGVRDEYHAGGSRSILLCEEPHAPYEA